MVVYRSLSSSTVSKPCVSFGSSSSGQYFYIAIETWDKIDILTRRNSNGLLSHTTPKIEGLHMENTRGISQINRCVKSLLSNSSKVFARILEKRIIYIVEPQLSENQYGFRTNKGCSDAIFILRQLQEKHIEWNKPLCMAFIDQEKAFDRIVRAELWKCLAERGIFGELLRAIQSLYVCSQAAVRTRAGETEWFEVKCGLRQGCVLSPLLFMILMDNIMKRANQEDSADRRGSD